MGYKKYDSHMKALDDMKPGEMRNVRINKDIVTIKKGNGMEQMGMLKDLTPPEKKAKVITSNTPK